MELSRRHVAWPECLGALLMAAWVDAAIKSGQWCNHSGIGSVEAIHEVVKDHGENGASEGSARRCARWDDVR